MTQQLHFWAQTQIRFTHQGRCSITYSSQDAKATRVSTDRWLDLKSYTYTQTHRNITQPLARATSCHVQQNGWVLTSLGQVSARETHTA